MHNDNNIMATGIALGALMGGAVALLLAPRNGRESREALKEGMGAVKSKVDALVNRRTKDSPPDPADSGKEDYLF